MRVNRSKFVRKYLRFFKIVYGITPPYNVVLDGNFVYAALKVKLDIKERVEKLLQGETVRLYVLKSVLAELNAVGPKAAEAFKFAKKFCTLIDDDGFGAVETPAERLVAWLRHQTQESSSSSSSASRHYFVATQDRDLRSRLGSMPGVPTLYLNKVVLVLEPPSGKSKEVSMELEASKVALTPLEAEVLQKVGGKVKGVHVVGGGDSSSSSSSDNSKESGSGTKPPIQERRKRKATASNPLASMKASDDSQSSKKRKMSKFRHSG